MQIAPFHRSASGRLVVHIFVVTGYVRNYKYWLSNLVFLLEVYKLVIKDPLMFLIIF